MTKGKGCTLPGLYIQILKMSVIINNLLFLELHNLKRTKVRKIKEKHGNLSKNTHDLSAKVPPFGPFDFVMT